MIFDTNALSAFADGDESLLECLGTVRELYVPVIVLAEYRFGIRQSRYRRSYEKWLDKALEGFEIIPVLESSTLFYASIVDELKKIGKPLPVNDIWIAALCREHGLPIVSRDAHFDFISGIKRLSWN